MVELKTVRTAGLLGGRNRMLVVFAWACAALLACAGTAAADSVLPPAPLSFVLAPAITIPLGPGSQYFLPGGTAELAVEYALPSIPMLSLGGGVLYGFTPIAGGLGTTSQLAGQIGAGWRIPILGRLSGRAFARAGYEVGLVNGDSVSGLGGSPLVEGGAGLSYAVGPAAVARLDASYTYLFGANGTLKFSVGLLMRPFPSPAPMAALKRRSSLEITGVDLQSVYPALRRSFDNHPAGKVMIRNTGTRRITDLHVSLRVKGFMEKPRESAARGELKAGDSWEAPLVVVLGQAAPDQKAASADGEIVVTWVEQGEPWEAQKSAALRVFEPHVIGADDLRKEAAFVLPFDPAVRVLSAAVSAAIPASTEAGADGSASAAIAAREAIRLLGIRTTGGSDTASTDGKDGPVRRVKYPNETLRDLSGTSTDVAVLCASILEAMGEKAALIEVNGKAFVAVGHDAAGTADTPQPGAEAVTGPDGHSWLPFEIDRTEETFHDAAAAGLKAWKAAQGSGGASFAPVREAWALYPPSPFPQADSRAPTLAANQLGDAVRTALADFNGTGPTPGGAKTARADSPARRLLVVFEPHPAGAYSEIQRSSLADSLALSLQRADTGVLVIPYGGSAFPGSTDKRIEAARSQGADCYVVVELSGDGASSVITAESFDMTSRSSVIAPATLAGTSTPSDSGPDWGPVIKLVADTYGKEARAAGR